MRLWAISDLHLPGGHDKPMDIFGAQWENHADRIASAWRERVTEEDAVLVPGDISWALRFEDALPDLAFIGALPGRKVILRGNHDYWWSGVTRVRAALAEGMYALQNDALRLGDVVICGTRGWLSPDAIGGQTLSDAKIYARELGRLRLSLSAADAYHAALRRVLITHFPPLTRAGKPNAFTDALAGHGVTDVLYGHLHGGAIDDAFRGVLDGVRYRIVSADALGFVPCEVPAPDTQM